MSQNLCNFEQLGSHVSKQTSSPYSHVSTGADNIKKYWSRYYQGSQGVIFVLDSASSDEDLEAARNELHSALQHPQLCTLPFLILANHQDKPAARPPNQVNWILKCCCCWFFLVHQNTFLVFSTHIPTPSTHLEKKIILIGQNFPNFKYVGT